MIRIGKLIGLGIVGFSINVAAGTAAFGPRAASVPSANAADTNLVYACVNNVNKSVRIVGPNDNCGNSESPRQWNITGPQGPQGAQGPQGLQGPAGPAANGGLAVKDSLGQVIGRWNFNHHMLRQVGTDLLNFYVDSYGFREGYMTFYYTTPDCTGPKYMLSFRNFGQFYETVATSDGQTGFFPSADVQDVTLQRYQQFTPGQTVSAGGACLSTFFTEKMGQVSSIDLMSVGLPPFTLE